MKKLIFTSKLTILQLDQYHCFCTSDKFHGVCEFWCTDNTIYVLSWNKNTNQNDKLIWGVIRFEKYV